MRAMDFKPSMPSSSARHAPPTKGVTDALQSAASSSSRRGLAFLVRHGGGRFRLPAALRRGINWPPSQGVWLDPCGRHGQLHRDRRFRVLAHRRQDGRGADSVASS